MSFSDADGNISKTTISSTASGALIQVEIDGEKAIQEEIEGIVSSVV